jgi:hypothetical protein
MPDMQMPKMQPGAMSMNEKPTTFVEEIEQHATSGTSAEPNSTPVPMLMTMKGSWTLMFHGVAFLNVQQQTGPRGADKVFSTNWLMPMAQRRLGPGTFTARTMLSFEPATITGRYYPELFQQGETAFGKPIVDGQHPHNFVMELAVLYDLNLGEESLLSFYIAPVGDPAMGPTAYPHRASASEDPIATLGHHLEDSTHISDDVITVGLTHRILRLEASGFHGREPDENRWTIEAGTIDSWSTRLTRAAGPELERTILFRAPDQPGGPATQRRHPANDGVDHVQPPAGAWQLGKYAALGAKSGPANRTGLEWLSGGVHAAIRAKKLHLGPG